MSTFYSAHSCSYIRRWHIQCAIRHPRGYVATLTSFVLSYWVMHSQKQQVTLTNKRKHNRMTNINTTIKKIAYWKLQFNIAASKNAIRTYIRRMELQTIAEEQSDKKKTKWKKNRSKEAMRKDRKECESHLTSFVGNSVWPLGVVSLPLTLQGHETCVKNT